MPPSRTQVLEDAQVATMDTLVRTTPADVIFERNTLLNLLWKTSKGESGKATPMLKRVGLGSPRVFRKNARELWIPVANQRSTGVTAFQHADVLPTQIDPVMTVQRAVYSYYTEFAAITWQEAEENSGTDNVIDIFASRLNMALCTLAENIETDLWASNASTTTTQKKIVGLQHLIPNDPTTGSVWGIDRATYTWQRSNTSNAADTFANVGLDKMRAMWTVCAGNGGVDAPGLILCTSTQFDGFTKAMEGKVQIYDAGLAEFGFLATAIYRGTPMTFSESCPSGKMFFFNLGYWDLCLPPGADFRSFDINMTAEQLLAIQKRIVWGGQWGCERFDRQGVIYGFTG